MGKTIPLLTIGQVARRTGLSVSAIRFYETAGLVTPTRNAGGQRRFVAADIRRLSFVLITQQLGFTLEEIRTALAGLPQERAPTRRDWERLAKRFRRTLDERIEMAMRLRERLDGCIGCGCLSLAKCELYNPADRAQRFGAGPRYLLGDPPNEAD